MHGFGTYALALAIATQPEPVDPGGELTINGSDTFGAMTDSGSVSLASSVAGSDTFGAMTDSGSVSLASSVAGSDTFDAMSDSGTASLGSDLVALTFFADATWTPGDIAATSILEGVGGGEGGTTNTHGGGGGAYSRVDAYARAQAAGIAIVVGLAGTAGGGNGGTTTINGTTLVAEGGGVAGAAAGGRASAGTGDAKYDGGAGTTAAGNCAGGASAGSAGAASGLTPGEPDGTFGAGAGAGVPKVPGGGGRCSASNQFAGAEGYVTITDSIPDDAAYATQVGFSRGRDAANSTSRDATLPSGVVGDLILVFVSSDGVPTITISGYTSIGSDVNGTAVKGEVFYRVATGSDAITIDTSASETTVFRVVRLRNAGTPTATFANAATGNADSPNHTPAGGSAPYVWYSACMLDATVSIGALNAFPSGYQGRMIPAVNSTGCTLAVTRRRATGASENPGAYANNSGPWVSCTVSVPRV